MSDASFLYTNVTGGEAVTRSRPGPGGADADADADADALLCIKLVPDWVCQFILVPLNVSIILENILLILTVWHGSSSSLSASSYVFLASLAVADALVGVCSTVMAVTYWRMYPDQYDLQTASPLYGLQTVIVMTLVLISIIHMAVLAFDRYLYIKRPFFYMRHVTRRVVMATIGASWLFGMAAMATPAFYYIDHPWISVCETIHVPEVFFFSIIITYCLVFALTVFAYFKIYQEVRRHKRSIAVLLVGEAARPAESTAPRPGVSIKTRKLETRETSGSFTSRNTNSDPDSGAEWRNSPSSQPVQNQRNLKSTIKIVKFLLLVFGTFVLCTGPSTICFVISSVAPMRTEVVFTFTSLITSNSVMNFILVVVRDRSFRRQLKRLFQDIVYLFR